MRIPTSSQGRMLLSIRNLAFPHRTLTKRLTSSVMGKRRPIKRRVNQKKRAARVGMTTMAAHHPDRLRVKKTLLDPRRVVTRKGTTKRKRNNRGVGKLQWMLSQRQPQQRQQTVVARLCLLFHLLPTHHKKYHNL
eukprot:PhF_6_TR37454/c1_g1_i2/m.55094